MKGNNIQTLHKALSNFLVTNTNDQELIELFKKIRTLQSNGYQLFEAILKAVESDKQIKSNTNITTLANQTHKDNIPVSLSIRHRAKLVKFRDSGAGYGKIPKLLKERNIFNRKTGKEYSRTTIKRALELVEKGKK